MNGEPSRMLNPHWKCAITLPLAEQFAKDTARTKLLPQPK